MDLLTIELIKTKCEESIQKLLLKYKDDDYMIQRIHNNIVNYLPITLDYELKNHEKRVIRNNFLTNEQQIFIQVFLSKNQYYYLPNNNYFYKYNGYNYTIVKEDDVIYNLLSNISKDRVLLDWKHKTKFNIIKQIKERSLFTTTPESNTIQRVLNVLYPHIFTTKTQAKYFLTIIGDNILRKNANLIFLVSPKIKNILNEVDNISYITIGFTNTTTNFITKYHETHSYDCCRLLQINEDSSVEIWKELLKKNGLDFICVASHYSNRYESSDNFIDTKADEEFKNYAYYLKNTTQGDIVSNFVGKYFQVVVDGNKSHIGWKHVHYMWKQFLSSLFLPNMIYSYTLKKMLKDLYDYDETTDTFKNIICKYLPVESDFLKFWEATIQPADHQSDVEIGGELEIDEICMLFKNWVRNQKNQDNQDDLLLSNGNITEDAVLKIIKHFFHTVEIEEDKYVLNVSCKMWNKVKDIEKSFFYMKQEIQFGQVPSLISVDEAYQLYCKFCGIKSYKYIISKRFFEKYLCHRIGCHIVYDTFIETDWFIQM
jgi:hypothetical protein